MSSSTSGDFCASQMLYLLRIMCSYCMMLKSTYSILPFLFNKFWHSWPSFFFSHFLHLRTSFNYLCTAVSSPVLDLAQLRIYMQAIILPLCTMYYIYSGVLSLTPVFLLSTFSLCFSTHTSLFLEPARILSWSGTTFVIFPVPFLCSLVFRTHHVKLFTLGNLVVYCEATLASPLRGCIHTE